MTAFRSHLSWLYRDWITAASTIFLLVVLLAAIFGPSLAPFDPYQTSLRARMLPPAWPHIMGTDEQGRDVFSRLLPAIRMTLGMGLLSLGLGGGLGILLGVPAAFYPRLDSWIMRAMDLLLSFPAVLLALVIVSLLGSGAGSVIVALTVATIPPVARIARSAASTVVHEDYVNAARVIGLSDIRILTRYVGRNCISLDRRLSHSEIGSGHSAGRFAQLLGFGCATTVCGAGDDGQSRPVVSIHCSPCFPGTRFHDFSNRTGDQRNW